MGKTPRLPDHQEINDHLPEKLVENETRGHHSMLNDMGVAVYEQAPDAATLLISNSAVHRHRRRSRRSR